MSQLIEMEPHLRSKKRFNKLYADHHQMVRNVLFNMVDEPSLEDLTQEVFVRVWTGLPRFASRSSVKTWIYRVTLNAAIDHLRRRALRPLLHASNTESFIESATSPSRMDEISDDRQALIQKALQEMDELHRGVVVLAYFEEQSLDDIARILEIPLGTVKSRLHSAKKKLKHILERSVHNEQKDREPRSL